MNKQNESARLEDRQAILEEIDALLAARNSIDETRAKRVRKALDAMRGNTAEAEAEAVAVPRDDTQLDDLIDARLETLRSRIHRQVERRKRDYDKALGLADELEQAVRDNELQKAQHAEKILLSIMGNIPGLSEQRWKDIEERLQRARPKLRKLESWRHWGTTQAREELIEQVRQLQGSDLHPNQIARSIQAAREQWQAWDQAGDQPGKELWNTFDRTCEAAYQPCIAHFAQLKEQRAANLKQRQALIEKLEARYEATDWKHPDWRDIDKFVSHTRREFGRIGNVDFRHRKPLQKALDTALERFEEHLARERTRSYRFRERLVEAIEALDGVDNLREAIDQLDMLKKQWEITVVESRKLENRLWKRYQAACDHCYRRREAQRKEQVAGRNGNMQQKQALIRELGAAAQGDAAQLLAHPALLNQFQDRWQQIGPVPREHEKKLDSSWRAAQKQFRSALEAARQRSRADEFARLAGRAALCHRLEQAVLAGDPIDTGAVNAEWLALPELSGQAAEAIERRFRQALARPDDTALADNLARKQDACVKLEVLLELATPEEYQTERMAYQVARLNAALQKDAGALESPEALLLSALVTGAVPADAAGTIEQRLNACIECYFGRM